MGIPMFAFSIFLATRLPFEFQPQADRGRAEFSVELPPGATLDETDAVVQRVTKALQARKEVVSVYASVGSNNAVNKADLTADLTDKKTRMSQKQFSRQMVDQFAEIPGVRIGSSGSQQRGGGPPRSKAPAIRSACSATTVRPLEAAARKVEAEMRGVPGLAHVVNTASDRPSRDRRRAQARPGRPRRRLGRSSSPQAVRGHHRRRRPEPAQVQSGRPPGADPPAPERRRPRRHRRAADPAGAVGQRSGAAERGGRRAVRRRSLADRTARDRSRVATITAELDGIVVGEAAKRVHALPSVKNACRPASRKWPPATPSSSRRWSPASWER
ncbi:efflux RND transporter permease subunit [Caulobacter segnis]